MKIHIFTIHVYTAAVVCACVHVTNGFLSEKFRVVRDHEYLLPSLRNHLGIISIASSRAIEANNDRGIARFRRVDGDFGRARA